MSDASRKRFPLQLPHSLKEMAAELAKEDGVSLNQWITVAVAQKVGETMKAAEFLRQQAEGGSVDDFRKALERAPTPSQVVDEGLDEAAAAASVQHRQMMSN